MLITGKADTDAPKKDAANAGFLSKLRVATPDVIKNNAPRIVAGLKICGSASMMFSQNMFFKVAGAGFITANTIIALFAGKKTEEQKDKLRAEEEAKGNGQPKSPLANYTNKLFHPQKYPIESGTGVAMLSSIIWTASGAFGKGGVNVTRLIGGAFSFASDANIVFTKERIGEERANPHPKGTFKHYVTELKNRPVLLSSLFNVACDITHVVGGGYEYFAKKKEGSNFFAGLFLLTANIFQAIFVNKNDYNIEKKEEAKLTAEEKPETQSLAPGETNAKDVSHTHAAWEKRIHINPVAEMSYGMVAS